MTKLGALHAYLQSLNIIAAEQIESWPDDWKNTPCFRKHTVSDQWVLTEKNYTGCFFFSSYPHGRISADLLISQISQWLLINDAERTDGFEFPCIADVLDAESANLEIHIPFKELVLAVQDDENGTIPGGDGSFFRIL